MKTIIGQKRGIFNSSSEILPIKENCLYKIGFSSLEGQKFSLNGNSVEIGKTGYLEISDIIVSSLIGNSNNTGFTYITYQIKSKK